MRLLLPRQSVYELQLCRNNHLYLPPLLSFSKDVLSLFACVFFYFNVWANEYESVLL